MPNQRPALIEPLKEIDSYSRIINFIKEKKTTVCATGLVDAQKPHMMYGVACHVKKNLMVITHSEMRAKQIYDDLNFLYNDEDVFIYPAQDILFYGADVHSTDITVERMMVMDALLHKENIVVIASIESLINQIMPKEDFLSNILTFEVGQVINLRKLEKQLIKIGYERASLVENIGQFTIRGGIIDIYPITAEHVYRIELWDDEIDSIRMVNPYSQRSIEKVDSIRILPMREMIYSSEEIIYAARNIEKECNDVSSKLNAMGREEAAIALKQTIKELTEQMYEQMYTKGLEAYISYFEKETSMLLDYMDKETLVVVDEPIKVKEQCEKTILEFENSMKDKLEYGQLLPKQINIVLRYEDIIRGIKNHSILIMMNLEQKADDFDINYKSQFKIYENTTFYKNFDLLEKDIKAWKNSKKRIVLFAGIKSRAERLVDELEERGIICNYSDAMVDNIAPGQVIVTRGALTKGFAYDDIGFIIISDKDLFGKEKKKRARSKRYKGTKIESFIDLKVGDFVVHENHGIGVFNGIEQMVVDNISKDYLKIGYADEGTLYVNINQMDLVQKYIGAEGKKPKLSKLGGQDWKKAKVRAQKATMDLAKELIQLYAKRESARGFVYGHDTQWQREFEDMFPYEETDDQLQAIEEVKADMETDKVMDRLLCGDVGYGKTEVAIRAAFKAVQDSKQVVYLVPTTILAQQHYNRFVERMQNFPIKIELLSRFRTPKQIKAALQGIEKGTVDIVIGTHRVLSKDVKFKDLGLVLIDEEQRFGVGHKEKLKQIRSNVDVLTLTATPIPRTLHMSLVGIRDMSVLEDPPLERRPVQTYVMEYSHEFVKDAIQRELARNGQVYFLYNRVGQIDKVAAEIQDMVPGANVAYAHGQMSERELEQIMLEFIEGEIDVLVCTTIIETGLDIANTNTIIIQDADKMGLSQLYQLRGRVGRSNRIAYAYLMYQKDKALPEIAEKRLQAIKQFTKFGSGFKIAMRDLEIRGAGNLLGGQQHGHMEAIGYDLYSKLLKDAVLMQKGEVVEEEFETSVEIDINAYIPNKYIEDEVQKLEIYKKIALIQDQKDYNEIQEEIEDRYGDLPQSVQNLLDVALIRATAHDIGFVSVSVKRSEVTFICKQDAKLDPTQIPKLLDSYGGKLKFVAGNKPYFMLKNDFKDKLKLVSYIKNVLQDIKKLKYM